MKRIYSDTYPVVVGIVVLAGIIWLILATLNPIR